MRARSHRHLSCLLGVGLVSLALFNLPAHAELVSTHEILASQQDAPARERIKTLMDRADVATQLESLGIAPQQARARVDAMTDAEIQTIAGKLGTLPAGGALGTYELILILLVVILVVLLI